MLPLSAKFDLVDILQLMHKMTRKTAEINFSLTTDVCFNVVHISLAVKISSYIINIPTLFLMV